MAKPIHVVRSGGTWALKREGRDSPISTHTKQKSAIETATQVAKPEKGEVIIHGRDGKIRARETYGPDPFPPRDKEH